MNKAGFFSIVLFVIVLVCTWYGQFMASYILSAIGIAVAILGMRRASPASAYGCILNAGYLIGLSGLHFIWFHAGGHL